MKRNKSKIKVLVGGCFDILHNGHLKFLEASKKQGDILIVALESDESVRRLKGKGRPINNEKTRTENLIKTGFVDNVIILPNLKTDNKYLQLVKNVSPDIIAITAGDPQINNKKYQAGLIGGKVKIVINRLPNFSTTEIIKNL